MRSTISQPWRQGCVRRCSSFDPSAAAVKPILATTIQEQFVEYQAFRSPYLDLSRARRCVAAREQGEFAWPAARAEAGARAEGQAQGLPRPRSGRDAPVRSDGQARPCSTEWLVFFARHIRSPRSPRNPRRQRESAHYFASQQAGVGPRIPSYSMGPQSAPHQAASGSSIRNVVPLPTSVVKSIEPLRSCTMRNVLASPMPLPPGRVVKKS